MEDRNPNEIDLFCNLQMPSNWPEISPPKISDMLNINFFVRNTSSIDFV